MIAPARRIAPPSFLAAPSFQRLFAALPEARVVGGAVRDWLLGHPNEDVDLATPRPPEAVMAALEEAGLRAIPTGLAHGTVSTVLEDDQIGRKLVEITTLRRDVRTDGRHAEVAFTEAWEDDAKRRDFTINALSMTPAGEVFDYVGGLADLAAGRVRFVGDPAARLAEDYLRLLRFFRFWARYGREPPDRATREALRGAVGGLGRLSPERVWSELKRLLAAPDPYPALVLMEELGVLPALLPEGYALRPLPPRPDPLLRLAAIFRGDPEQLARRLRLSRAEEARLAALQGPLPDPARLRAALAETPREILIGRAELAGRDDLARALAALEAPQFPLRGADLRALGVPEGPGIGQALAAARAHWLATNTSADRAELLAYLAPRLPALLAASGKGAAGEGGAAAPLPKEGEAAREPRDEPRPA